MKTPPDKKRGRGQPKKEPTVQIRAYASDVAKLAKHGRTHAEAVRELIAIAKRAKAALMAGRGEGGEETVEIALVEWPEKNRREFTDTRKGLAFAQALAKDIGAKNVTLTVLSTTLSVPTKRGGNVK